MKNSGGGGICPRVLRSGPRARRALRRSALLLVLILALAAAALAAPSLGAAPEVAESLGRVLAGPPAPPQTGAGTLADDAAFDGEPSAADDGVAPEERPGPDPAPTAAPKTGDSFQQTGSVLLDGEPVPCWFTITSVDAGGATVEIGSGQRRHDSSLFTYVPAIDLESSGDLSFLPSVTHDNVGYAITALGAGAFEGCYHITSTGLAGNTTIRMIGHECYDSCFGLTRTGLEDNHTVEGSNIGTSFAYCFNLISTGLERNTTYKKVNSWDFRGCRRLTSTGLESNTTVTSIGYYAFADCTNLASTGLQKTDRTKDAVAHVGPYAFFNDTKLTSTGLDDSVIVSYIGCQAFYGCTQLGGPNAPTDTVNAGDVLINQPVDPQTKEKKEFKLGLDEVGTDPGRIFTGTRFTRLYLLCDRDLLTCAPDALAGSKITTVYVNATWEGVAETGFTGPDGQTPYSVDGDGGYRLVVMDPLQAAGPATRPRLTSDAASVRLEVDAPIEVEVAGGGAGRSWSGRVGSATGPLQRVDFPIAAGTGLDPSGGSLTVSSDTEVVYPAGAARRPYNRASGTTRSCELPAVSYSVAFDANGGTGSMPDQPMSYGSPSALVPCAFSRARCEFAGWSTRADGGGAAFADGATVRDLTDLEGATVVLYARWRSTVSLTLAVRARGSGRAPLAGCGLELSCAGGAGEAARTGSDGEARFAGLAPGPYRLAGTRAPAGYRPMGRDRTFEIDADGSVRLDGRRIEPEDGSFGIELDFQPNPGLPPAGGGGASRPPLAAAGAAAAVLSAVYLAARRAARG